MIIYLVRHGEALSEREDPARPLSMKGETDIRELAALLAQRLRLMPGHIFHSAKLRAAQTASIISQALPQAPAPDGADGLAPMDDPAHWMQRLETMEKDTMLVGHLPHLQRLASLLLVSDTGRDIVDLTPGAVLCLERTGSWKVKWMVSPDVIKKV